MSVKENLTIRECFDLLAQSNGACMKIVFKNESGKPFKAVIFVDGEIEATEIVNAVIRIEDEWAD